LEDILAETVFDAALKERAGALVKLIVGRGLTKYNPADGAAGFVPPGGRKVILVPGQVADDESVRLGGAELFAAEPMDSGGANLALLKEVRARFPEAFVVFRPHPDVLAGLRAGHVPGCLAREYADHIDTGPSILPTMQLAERVETLTSLAGFEALLRGKPVTVHGQPFYAGWGLTEDIRPVARRRRRLALEELVAGALILYPRYHDPVSRRPCPVEVAAERLIEIRSTPRISAGIRAAGGRALARSRYLVGRLQGVWPKDRNSPDSGTCRRVCEKRAK
jgi:capsular polysaccharide export protein